MKIGELAQATKLSVRTLHHYDEVGLLKPSSRTESDHRLYTKSDVERLHKIVSLRNIGFSLEEIGQVIGLSQEKMRELIDRKMEELESQREETERKIWCLKAANDFANFNLYQGKDNLVNIIRELTIQSQYLTQDERNNLDQAGQTLGLDKIKELHLKMAQLVEQTKTYMEQNIDPKDPQVVSIATQWKTLGTESLGDNLEIAEKMKAALKENPDFASYRGVTQRMIDYLRSSLDRTN